jgi:hypothetical protein
MPRALVACGLLLLGGAATSTAAAQQPSQQQPQKKQGPLILPLRYKQRHYASPVANAFSTMSVREGGDASASKVREACFW